VAGSAKDLIPRSPPLARFSAATPEKAAQILANPFYQAVSSSFAGTSPSLTAAATTSRSSPVGP